ncbi:hypothetical protein ABK040_002733 [Willaertia magna]
MANVNENDSELKELLAEALKHKHGKDDYEKDYDKAFEIINNIVQNHNDYIPAKHELALLYKHGKGVKKDLEKAKELYLQCCEKNYPRSVYDMGFFTFDESICGKGNRDMTTTMEWWTRSAELGYKKAQYNVGYAHYLGKDVQKDWKKAEEWLLKSSEQGYISATYYLCLMYEDGSEEDGFEKNYDKAYEYLLKLVELNHPAALYTLGALYKREYSENYVNLFDVLLGERDMLIGKHAVDKPPYDLSKAYEYLLKGAEAGHSAAQFELAEMYFESIFVERNTREGLHWLEEAADQDYAPAQYNLGMILYDGDDGIEQNKEEGIQWVESAAELGYPLAIKALEWMLSGEDEWESDSDPEDYEFAA